MQRAAVSVPANIAEGYRRLYRTEYVRYIAISHASLAELETHLEIAKRINYIDADEYRVLLSRTDLIGKQLYTLRKALVG
jgi:four helix bundle protein